MATRKRAAEEEWWLAKVPAWLLAEWEKANALDETASVGFFAEEEEGKRVFTAKTHVKGFPKEFNVATRPAYTGDTEADPVYVFTEGEAGPGRVVGRLTSFVDLLPADSEAYRARIRNTFGKSRSKARMVEVLPEASGVQSTWQSTSQPLLVSTSSREKSAPRFVSDDLHRARLPEAELRPLLFRLFEEREMWSFAELQKRTEQPSKWLREVLAVLCLFHKSGAHIHQYELKDEFKIHRAEE